MPPIAVNDVELFYETSGDPSNPAVLLVAGLGVQLIDWADYFVDGLLEQGYYIIRFDNRDIGLSRTFDGAPNDPQVVVDDMLAGKKPNVRYTLNDMAADAAALLDALSVEAAHIVGVSMGGMIAQAIAINHPGHVLSLTSIMSSTGAPDVGQPTPEAMAAILSPAAGTDREAVIEASIESARIWASPGMDDEVQLRALFENAWDRIGGAQAKNSGRQFCAIMATPPRDLALASVAVPALVVHGTADTLINVDGGHRTANCIPNAELLIIDGMGHDMPPLFASIIVTAIDKLASSAKLTEWDH